MIIPGDNRGLRRPENWSRGQPHQCSNLARTLVPAIFFFEPAAWGPNGVGVSSEDARTRPDCPRNSSLVTHRWSEGDSNSQSQEKGRPYRHVILNHRTAVR